MLREIQNMFVASNQEPQMVERINYAIDKIGQRTIFDIDYPLIDSLDLAIQTRPSVTKGWLGEFSSMGLEILRETSLNAHNDQQKKRQSQQQSPDTFSAVSRAPSLTTINNFIDEHRSALEGTSQIDFDTLKFCQELGRRSALSVITMHILKELRVDTLPQINQTKLSRFLGQIYRGYRRDVEYHNDMHAIDVLQMCYIFLTQG